MEPAAEQGARDITSANGKQANLENLTEPIANRTKVQIAGELQALQTDKEQVHSEQIAGE